MTIQWEERNLRHVLSEACTDPDCELHNIDVAIEEEVVTPTDIAYFCVGFMKAVEVLRGYMQDGTHDGEDALLDEDDLASMPEALLDLLGPEGKAIYGT